MPDAGPAMPFTVPPNLVFRAIRQGDTAALESYLKQGTDLSARNEAGDTPLHEAVQRGKEDMALMLIAAGAPLDIKNLRAETPLAKALALRSRTAAAMLETMGAKLYAAWLDKANTPEMTKAFSGGVSTPLKAPKTASFSKISKKSELRP